MAEHRKGVGAPMIRAEGEAYLTRCCDEQHKHWSGGVEWSDYECPICEGDNDAGYLRTPCSRYGRTSAECAPVAWDFATAIALMTGDDVDEQLLDHAMSLVVNDSDDVANLLY